MGFKTWAVRFTLLVILITGGGALYADIYGSVSGTVRDGTGSALPGVTVAIAGPQMPGGRQVITEENGQFRFLNLKPGDYTVTASLAGLGETTASVRVAVDNDAQIRLTLSPAVREEIVVRATAAPVIDTKSTQAQFNYTDEMIENLPLARTYAGLLQLAPGVADNASFAPNAGGSRQDNTFMVDGVNVTEPFFGQLSTETNELDIEDFNIKRAGFTPEFGRSSGMVTNAVTKSGTNELRGAARFEYQPKEFTAETRTGVEETLDRMVPAFSLGGPIIRDRAFWYGSGRFYRAGREDRTNLLGPVPDQEIETNELFGKLSFYPTQAQLLDLSYRRTDSTNEFAGVGRDETPSVATDDEERDIIGTAHWTWTMGGNTLIEARFLTMRQDNSSVARTQLGARGPFDPLRLAQMGYVFDSSVAHASGGGQGAFVGGAPFADAAADYGRDEVKASVGRFFDLGNTSHEVKVGGGWDEGTENLYRISNAWGIISLVQNGTQYRASYYPDQPAQLGIGTTYSVYVQDQVTVGSRLVFNVGVLANRDEFAQETDEKRTFLEFGFEDEIQPRLGVSYGLRDVGDKLYANYGRYYNMEQKSTARALAPRRLFTSTALFNAQTGALISDAPSPATVSKNISPDIVPTHTDEFLIGYATPLGSLWSAESYFMYRTTEDFIEDFPAVAPASQFIYDNIGAERKYYALTLNIRRGFANRWTTDVNYTWSRLYGNYDQDYFAGYGSLTATGAVFNTSSALNDGPGTFFDDANRYGPLALNRTHVFKAFGSYEVLSNLTLGGYLRVQSGTPWEARGRDWTNRYLVYLEPAGTNTNPWWTNFDLLASYRVPFGRYGVSVEARVLNLFDTQTRLMTDPRVDLGGRIRTSAPPWIEQPTNNPNPSFGKGMAFADPRRFIASVKIDF